MSQCLFRISMFVAKSMKATVRPSKSAIFEISKPVEKKEDRLALYIQLKADDQTVRSMNVPYQFPLQVYGQDGKTYVLDQFADQDGIYRFHILQRNGPYAYEQVYSGDPFILKTEQGQTVGDKSAFLVSHFIGNDNSTDVLPGSANNPSPVPQSDISKMKSGVKFNWGNLLKAAPSVIGHVVQIGTTIASVMGVQDDNATLATNTLKTTAVDGKTGFYQIIIHDL